MKIYTRSRKPKLYSILALSGITAVILYLLVIFRGQIGEFALGNIAVLLVLYFAAVIAILAVSLKRQLEYNPYSYNTIYYFGFALFVLSLLISVGAAAIQSLKGISSFSVSDAALLILNSSRVYMRVTAPLLAVFAFGLASSNLVLILREGARLANILGILLSVAMLLGEVFLFVFDGKLSGVGAIVADVFCAVFLYYECMLFGTVFADIFAAVHRPEYDKDYIIILGCRVGKDSAPTPLLSARVDRALEFGREQLSNGGKEIVYIASGGKGADEPISEAECIRRRLLDFGIPDGRIIVEDKSTDTLENMRFSMEKVGYEGKFAFSTTNYHVFRSGIASNRAKKRSAEGVGAATRWYFWPNASVREFIGLLTEHRGKQALILAGLVAMYVLIALFV